MKKLLVFIVHGGKEQREWERDRRTNKHTNERIDTQEDDNYAIHHSLLELCYNYFRLEERIYE